MNIDRLFKIRFGGFDERRQKQQQHHLHHYHPPTNQLTTNPPGNWHDSIISTINNTTINLHNRDNQEKRDSCSWAEEPNSNNTLGINTNTNNSNRYAALIFHKKKKITKEIYKYYI